MHKYQYDHSSRRQSYKAVYTGNVAYGSHKAKCTLLCFYHTCYSCCLNMFIEVWHSVCMLCPSSDITT